MQRYQQTKHALGSEVLLTVIVKDEAESTLLFESLWEYLEEFEQRFSRFRSDSELSQFNTRAGQWIEVSPAFSNMLSTCQQFSRLTDGLFNPFILPKLQLVGYKGSWPHPDSYDETLDMSGRDLATADAIELDGTKARIPEQTALDFGGIGKGYALDALSDITLHQGIKHFWFSLGGDIVCHGNDSDGLPWSIEIASVQQPDVTVATVSNPSTGLLAIATSGVTKRRGDTWHHIIDPRTGLSSSSNVVGATVLARTGTAADIYAKSFVIEPNMEREKMPSSTEILGTLLQMKDATVSISEVGGYIHEC